MLPYDPVLWLMKQRGPSAVRARRALRIECANDEECAESLAEEHYRSQLSDGSFDHSPMKTACVLNLLVDLRTHGSRNVIAAGASYLISVLESQPGYERARGVAPGGLAAPCDLCGFFGPYESRSQTDMLAAGAREMNFLREFEPLIAPKAPVRAVRRSPFDRVGPSSCYAWGLVPLSIIIQSLSRSGFGQDKRVQPAINALLGAQRKSGGWCRNLCGHPVCTLYALHAIGSHPRLRKSEHANRALTFISKSWRSMNPFSLAQVLSRLDLPSAHSILQELFHILSDRQYANGSFGAPCRVERVCAIAMAEDALKSLTVKRSRC